MFPMFENWDGRYAHYAREYGRGVEEMLRIDGERFPGGRLCAFMIWAGKRWSEWNAEGARVDFGAWLGARAERNQRKEVGNHGRAA